MTPGIRNAAAVEWGAVGASCGGTLCKDRWMSLARRVRAWAGGTGLWRKIAIALAAAASASGIAT